MKDRSTERASIRIFRVVSLGLVALSTLAIGLMFMAPGSATSSQDAQHLGADPFKLSCKLISATGLDFVPPEDAEMARQQGWATTPDDALKRILASSLFPSERFDSLNVGTTRTTTLGDSETEQTVVTQYSMTTASGSTVAVVSVQDVGFGAYAPVGIEVCSE